VESIVDPGRLHVTMWRMRVACWITKATNTQLGYVILIVFPLQHWLNERASMLRYMYGTLPVLFRILSNEILTKDYSYVQIFLNQ
jgi:hypothetical protein